MFEYQNKLYSPSLVSTFVFIAIVAITIYTWVYIRVNPGEKGPPIPCPTRSPGSYLIGLLSTRKQANKSQDVNEDKAPSLWQKPSSPSPQRQG